MQLGFIRFYRIFLDVTGFYRVFLDVTWVLVGF